MNMIEELRDAGVKYIYPVPKDILPELICFGTVEMENHIVWSGATVDLSVIEFEKRKYIMAMEAGERWMDER